MKQYRFIKDVTIYERDRSPKWTTTEPVSWNYRWVYYKGDTYEGANRTEFGKWLLANNFVEEVNE